MKSNRVWITGASRGIGYDTALLLAKNGFRVFLTSRNLTDKVNRNILKNYQNSSFIRCDVSVSSDVLNAYGEICKIAGGVDILINNAGIILYNKLVDTTEEEFDQIFGINLKGAYLTSKTILPELIKRKSGLIINISSIAANSRFTCSSLYSASKAGLLTMSRILRDEVRKFGIKVVDILPGATDTDMWDTESRKLHSSKMMKPEDIAKVILNVIEMNQEKRIMTEELIIRPIGGDL